MQTSKHCLIAWNGIVKGSLLCALFVCVLLRGNAAACAVQGDSCVTSATASGDIIGDQAHLGRTTVTVYLNSPGLALYVAVADTATLDKFYCDGGGIVEQAGCYWPNMPSGSQTVTVSYTGLYRSGRTTWRLRSTSLATTLSNPTPSFLTSRRRSPQTKILVKIPTGPVRHATPKAELPLTSPTETLGFPKPTTLSRGSPVASR